MIRAKIQKRERGVRHMLHPHLLKTITNRSFIDYAMSCGFLARSETFRDPKFVAKEEKGVRLETRKKRV